MDAKHSRKSAIRAQMLPGGGIFVIMQTITIESCRLQCGGMRGEMLGGSFAVALLRNGMGAILMMGIVLLLDRPRLSMKKTVLCYILFGILMVLVFSAWYGFDRDGYIRFSGIMSLPAIGIFCAAMSGEGIYLSFYKISLGFYLLSICVFLGIDVSRLWFGGNKWVDIGIRMGVCILILTGLAKRYRKFFFESLDFLREEMDASSLITLIVSFILAAFVALWPTERTFSVMNMIRIAVIMFMAGVIQYLTFHLYLHLGKEHCYQAEKQLLEMNEQFLRRQLELEKRAEEEAARIRHDVRHHCMLIRQYVRDRDTESLLAYLKQYGEDVENARTERLCGNRSVNGILSSYAHHARKEGIRVRMVVTMSEDPAVRDIDLVAILANLFENAIQGCLHSGAPEQEINMSITQKGHKIVIQCRNTCGANIRFRNGLPRPEKGNSTGMSSIVKTAARYVGETDFLVEDGTFLARVLLNLPGGGIAGVPIKR